MINQIVGAPSYKKLVKTAREQMTNRDTPHFFHTQMPNPNCKDGVTLTFSIPR
jgi:hypothetical protein